MDNNTNHPVVGIVWPGYAVFPDFMNLNITPIWETFIAEFRSRANFSGIWFDMN